MRVYEATLEFRIVQEGRLEALDSPEKVAAYMVGAFDAAPMQEAFYVICLNQKNKPLGRHLIGLGTAHAVLVHPREIFRVAVLATASGIICVHNHTSGDPTPSAGDRRITEEVQAASLVMGIPLLDHVIVGREEDDPCGLGYFSFCAAGLFRFRAAGRMELPRRGRKSA